jgi:TfoX/Sxy family transcriptional regulator of competence genes
MCASLKGADTLELNDQGFVSLWVWKHLNKLPLKYIGFGGYGNQMRDLLHIEDLNMLILEQIKNSGERTAKKMFGEYGIYSNGILFGLICDNKLFIKPTNSGRKFIGNVVEAPPYEGAKPSFLIEDKIEDCEWLSELVRISLNELPAPKPKKKK